MVKFKQRCQRVVTILIEIRSKPMQIHSLCDTDMWNMFCDVPKCRITYRKNWGVNKNVWSTSRDQRNDDIVQVEIIFNINLKLMYFIVKILSGDPITFTTFESMHVEKGTPFRRTTDGTRKSQVDAGIIQFLRREPIYLFIYFFLDSKLFALSDNHSSPSTFQMVKVISVY